MTNFPVSGHISNAARTQGEVQTDLENTIQASKETVGGSPVTTLVISSSTIVPTASDHLVDTSGGTAVALNNALTAGVKDGSHLTIRSVSTSRTIVVNHAKGGQGQFILGRGSAFILTDPSETITFQLRGGNWNEIERFYGNQYAQERLDIQADRNSSVITATTRIYVTDWNRHFIATGAGGWSLTAAGADFANIDGFKIYFENESTGAITFNPKPVYVFQPGEGAVIMCNMGVWSVLRGVLDTTKLVQAAAPADISNETAVAKYISPDQLFNSRNVRQMGAYYDPSASPPTVFFSYNVSSIVRNGIGSWTINLSISFFDTNWTLLTEINPTAVGDRTVCVMSKTVNAATINLVDGTGSLVDITGMRHAAFGRRI